MAAAQPRSDTPQRFAGRRGIGEHRARRDRLTRAGRLDILTTPPTTPPTTSPTTPPPGNQDAYAPVQAESYDTQAGTAKETSADTGGGQDLTTIGNGDWAQYKGVDFGANPATRFHGRGASGAAAGVSGLVEVRLDSRTNPPVGSFAVAGTGGWQSWKTVPANITGVTGTHDVYLTFTSGQSSDFVNLNWFTFAH
ncbi:hypothetical protein SAVIM338S_07219 [Streptomyces avidinii]